jgi:hypothetical protein
MNGIIYKEKYTKMNKINGWENILLEKIIIDTRKSYKNVLSINTKEVEPCDLTYENHK